MRKFNIKNGNEVKMRFFDKVRTCFMLTMLGCGVAGVQKGTLAYRVQKRAGLVDDKEQIPEIEPEERESFNKTLV